MPKHEIVVPTDNLPAWIYLHEHNQAMYIEPHWHSSVEISYTLSGHIANFFIDGQSYMTSPGDILAVNSMMVHSIRTFHNPEEDSKGLTIIFPYHIIKRYKADINDFKFSINRVFGEEEKSDAYRQLQEKLETLAILYHGTDHLRKTILLLEILELLLDHFLIKRIFQLNDKHDTKKKERLSEIKSYIEENYRADIELEDIANACYLSKEHLARFFKEQMNITVFQYLNYVRAKRARPLLLEGKMTATQVAIECGFSGLRTLDRALLKNFGQTSREIKAQGRQ